MGHLLLTSSRFMMRIGVLLAVVFASVLFPFPAFGQEDGEFNADISGHKTFTLRYGIGDPQGLGQSPYQLELDQTLAIDVTAEALSILTLKAHFNDQEPPSMQSLTLYLHSGDLSGVFGDFSLSGKEAFAVYNKKLKGVRLDYQLPGGGELTGVLSQIEGISESKTFIGHSAREEVTFSFSPPEKPWETQPYTKSLDGLYHYRLSAPYIEGFSEVDLTFEPSGDLQRLLTGYGLGYLYKTIAASPAEELKQAAFTVVPDQSDYLVLLRPPQDLLRTRLLNYIKAYNEGAGLTGKEKKRYPLNPGTDYEKAFLNALSQLVSLTVDGDPYPLSSGGRHRFYFLGEKDIKEGSVVVEVSIDGATFRPITDPDLSAYQASTFHKQGILEVEFPNAFFSGEKSAMRVSFSYSVSGNAYPLGLSIVPGSEKVYLNGKLLSRDSDYTIDYEIGMLILLVEVKDNDTIRIDYERARGGLGSAAEYSRNFYGVSLKIPVSDALFLEGSVLQAADSPTPLTDPDKVRTMPNTHTVSGIVGRVNLDGFAADFTIGYSDNRFPFDDNARVNLPNEISAITSSAGYTFFAHAAGVSVYHDGDWNLYTAADGLSANRVYAVEAMNDRVFFATAAGITVLNLAGEAPLEQVGNWRRYSTDVGLPNRTVHSLTIVDGVLWAGTEEGIVAVGIDEMDDPMSWKAYTDQEIVGLGTIRAIGVDGKTVYLGSERGLFAFDPDNAKLTPLSGMNGVPVNAVLVRDGTLYAASDLGLRTFKEGVGTGWLVFGRPVYTVAFVDGSLWYGDENGLHLLSGEDVYSHLAVTAIAPDGAGGVWAGTRAGHDYEIEIIHVEAGTFESYTSAETKIDGRDPGRFTDIPAALHTDRGGIARASFTRELGPFTLSGTFERISPQFTAIGRLGREDKTGWKFDAKADLADDLSLVASHSYYLVDLSSDHPKRTLDNSAALSWEFGPILSLTLNHGLVDDDRGNPGFDSGKLGYGVGLSEKLFSDSLSLALNWRDCFTWKTASDVVRRDTSLDLNASLKASQDLTLSGSFSRPVSFTEKRTGNESLTGNLNWSHRFPFGTLATNYGITIDRPLGNDTFRGKQDGKLNLRAVKFAIGDLSLRPVLTATFQKKEGILTVGAGGTLTLGYSGFTATTNYNHELAGLWEPREQVSDRLTLRLSYSGIPDLRPSITYTWNRSAVIYQGVPKQTVNQSLIGKLSYRPPHGMSDELSFSLRTSERKGESSLTGNLTNTFIYPMSERISARIVLDGRYSGAGAQPQLNLSLRGGTDFTLSDTWSTSFSASYMTGLKSGGGLYNSLLLELTVTATF